MEYLNMKIKTINEAMKNKITFGGYKTILDKQF